MEWTAPPNGMRMTIREVFSVAVIGVIITIVSLFFLIQFKHSSDAVSMASLIVIYPFSLASNLREWLPGIVFWGFFILAQIVYILNSKGPGSK